MSTQTPEVQLDKLSISELEAFLDGKKAMLVALGQKKQTILDELTDIDKQVEELTGANQTASNLSRSEAMKESWRKRREESKDAVVGPVKKASLIHVVLGILQDASPKMLTLDQIAQEVKKAKWRGRGGPVRQAVYAAIYNFNKKPPLTGHRIRYNKAFKTYGIK
tara:strand:- start:41 stop:535 length:495 start_codon:yes stop_codon:yes gene_type:complete